MPHYNGNVVVVVVVVVAPLFFFVSLLRSTIDDADLFVMTASKVNNIIGFRAFFRSKFKKELCNTE